ncbi:bifunctional heptose 7-phosphate kinase/heptose 1-phosphate adenyltransferase, partial [Enterococcus faecium]|uniref:PfkB family carbohydrate kinase n=1 Tax=Enterococcus faecium TaxID=1352 RepID=UPI00113E74AF
ARNIAHLDAKVGLLGLIGDDAEGDSLCTILQQDGIYSALLKQQQLPTIAKMRVISRHQQVVRLDVEQSFSQAHSEALADQVEALLPDYDY